MEHKKGKYANGFISHRGTQWYTGDGSDYHDATHFIDENGGIVEIEDGCDKGRGYWTDDGVWAGL